MSSILMYHGVGRSSPRHRYDIGVSKFERQLELLASRPVISLDTLLSGSEGVALTFDDGDATCLSEVAPRLVRRNWPAIAYVTTGYLNRAGFLRSADLRDLVQAGMLIGAHGHTHRSLDVLSDAELSDELVRSKGLLEQALGSPVRHMALPGGAGSHRVTEAARRAGFESIATSWPAAMGRRRNRYRLPRIAVRAVMTEATFRLIVTHSPRFYLGAQAYIHATKVVRRLIGSSAYESLSKVRQVVRGR